jgi:prolyl oligopeptidase
MTMPPTLGVPYPVASRRPEPNAPDDPYRWLEDSNAAETVAWCEAQQALYAEHAGSWDIESFKRRIAELARFTHVSAPRKRGAAEFYTRLEPEDEH